MLISNKTSTAFMTMTIHDAVMTVAGLMELSARTAPKGMGQDYIEAIVLTDEQRQRLGQDMLELGRERQSPGFLRDGQNVIDSEAVVLIGLMPHKGVGLNCQACGFSSCEEFNSRSTKGEFDGPNCAIRLLDLGIAIGSAAKTASDMNVDNRVMYRIGVSAKRLGLSKSRIVHGIPLSAKGKNIFFDRAPLK